jgi:hypothetical protein
MVEAACMVGAYPAPSIRVVDCVKSMAMNTALLHGYDLCKTSIRLECLRKLYTWGRSAAVMGKPVVD